MVQNKFEPNLANVRISERAFIFFNFFLNAELDRCRLGCRMVDKIDITNRIHLEVHSTGFN